MAENFIPFYKHQLKSVLKSKLTKVEAEEFDSFCQIIESVYHFKYHNNLEQIKEGYVHYDPDAENNYKLIGKPEKHEHEMVVTAKIKELLKAGNYEEISHSELEKAFDGSSPWGLNLKVDFSKYRSYSIFYRGIYEDSYESKILFKKKRFNFDVYSRVVFMFAMNESQEKEGKKPGLKNLNHEKIYLKIFKNVPMLDLEMMFPGTKVQIKLIDKLKVIIPLTAGIVSSVSKIVHYIAAQGNPVKMVNQAAFWTLIGGFFLFSLKSFMNYKNTVEKYLKTLTQNLYFQNLDNNSGVIRNLIDDAEEQEWKEVVLSYFFLYIQKNPITQDELTISVERFLKDELGADVFFETEDAVRKLRELEIVNIKDDKLQAAPISEALKKLDEQWDNYFKF